MVLSMHGFTETGVKEREKKRLVCFKHLELEGGWTTQMGRNCHSQETGTPASERGVVPCHQANSPHEKTAGEEYGEPLKGEGIH